VNGLQAKIEALEPGTVAVLGIPFDANSSFLRGAAGAPQAIRAALHSGSANLCSEAGVDLSSETRWRDLGDLQLADAVSAFDTIENAIGSLMLCQARVLTLGGDHSITYPVLRAYSKAYPKLDILHLDAHPDLYDAFQGNRHSHACPLARILEEGLAQRVVQLGIRGMNPHQREQAQRFGVEVVEMRHWRPDVAVRLEGPVYLSLDMDCLDPAFAPGVSHREPGGFSTRDVLGIIQGLQVPMVGADIVELNPRQDASDVTARAAAKLMKEVVAHMLE
jgi:agmatinase